MYRVKLFEPFIEGDEIEAVVRVLKSGQLAQGPEVEAFENEFAAYLGVGAAAAVSNGTAALFLTLKALGIKPGDEVLVPDYTFIATATSVLMLGAKPVLVDVEWDTFNMSVEDLQNKVTDKTKAVIAVHLFGHPADVKALVEVAEDKRLILVEDAAQAHGAEAWGRKVGTFGHAAIFSFYATKNMTMGEGGVVVSNDRSVIERVKRLRNHGQVARYVHEELGGNFRITSMQAALGRAQLRKLDRLNEIRRENARLLNAQLSALKELIELPIELPWAKHVYHVYALKMRDPTKRDCVADCMVKRGVEVAVHYPLPVHEQPLFKSLGYNSCCPNATRLSKCELSLPVHPKLGREGTLTVAESLKMCLNLCRE